MARTRSMSGAERLVLPGDEVAVVEEYESGEGTYEDGGRVFAAQPGYLRLDTENKVARVVPLNPPALMSEGDIIYGTINDIRPSMVEARVLAIHGRDRQVAGEIDASLHISKISNSYVEDPRDAVRPGDFIRARVIQTDPSLQITTAEKYLGVVLALCSNCRGPMERRGDGVHCPRCDRTDRRKMAADYGDPELKAPIPSEPEPGESRREPREWDDRGRGPPRGRGGGGRREGGGRGGRDRDRRGPRR
ncbi:MAG TPA: exosome complex RNA-binding protein Csl4 [Thermoplasmata archaeon]|nr:exosome complex RNA-binding protein Csl4 [Thermoplasmata archaeon]